MTVTERRCENTIYGNLKTVWVLENLSSDLQTW